MQSFFGFYRRVLSHAWKGGKTWARDQIGIAIFLAVLCALVPIWRGFVGLSNFPQTVLSLLYAYGLRLVLFMLVRLLLAPWELDRERQSEVEGFRSQHEDLSATHEAARQEIRDLRKRLADSGPNVRLRYDKSALYNGFILISDQDICEVAIREVETGSYVLTADRLTDVRAEEATRVTFHSVPKDKRGRVDLSASEGFDTAFDDYCGATFRAEIPLEMTYGDLRGNPFRVRWFVVWDKVRARMGLIPEVRRDPRSYALVEQDAARMT